MANINNELNKIKTAVYGKEVRGSIHDGIDKINKETENTTDLTKNTEQRQTNLEQQFTDVIENDSVSNPSNLETVAARTNTNTNKSYDTLGKRLDAEQVETQNALNSVDSQLAQTAQETSIKLNSKADKVVVKQLEEKKANQSDLEIESERINNLVTHNNDTEGNAELRDIRVGWDGITYESAGDAVRSIGKFMAADGDLWGDET